MKKASFLGISVLIFGIAIFGSPLLELPHSLVGNVAGYFFSQIEQTESESVPRFGAGENNIVFVTSTTHTGDLGGISGADNVCQMRANSAGLTGTYRAWLSTASSSPAGRFPQSTSPYTLVNGTVIANNWTDLTDGSLIAPIDRDELGNTVATPQVWSGTASDGTYPALGNCNDWIGTGSLGTLGFNNATNGSWSSGGIGSCTINARLYCFLQLVPEIDVRGNNVSIVDGDPTPSLTNHTDFGSTTVPTGTVVRTFAIHNTGTTNLNIGAITLGGTNAGDFSIDNTGMSPILAPGGNTAFNVTFDPSAPGQRTATVSIVNDDADENPYDFAIRGTGTLPAILSVDPTSVNFGDVTIGAPAGTSSVVITNNGGPVEITALPITGTNAAEFGATAVGGLPVTLANGASLTVNLTFNPSATGSRSASLGVTSTPTSTLTVALSGTGIEPDTTPPDTTITVGTSGTIFDDSAVFQFVSNEPGSTFECSMDTSAWTPCLGSLTIYTSLTNGNHLFEVRAIDAAGNIDPSPATRAFTVRAGTGEITFRVDRLDDSASGGQCTSLTPNDCTLRQAVGFAIDGDTVTFNAGLFSSSAEASTLASPQTIVLGGTAINVTVDLTIAGPGSDLLTIDGNMASRIYNVSPGTTASIQGLRLTGGNPGSSSGGAIQNGGVLTLDEVWIDTNQAGTLGGGVANLAGGVLTITNSTVSGNSAAAGGGIDNQGTLTVRSSTISGNFGTSNSLNNAGGIFTTGNALIEGSTIANNSVGGNLGAGGITRFTSGTVTVQNSIIAANINNGIAPDIDGEFSSGGFNLIGNGGTATGFTNGVNSDQVGDSTTQIDPLLGPLQDNGGPTHTHALMPGSPAIDAGSAFGAATDQRGSNRTVNYPSVANVDDGTDIGAYELLAPTAAPASISGRVLTRTGAGIRGAIVTVQGMDGGLWSVTTNTFGHYRIEGLVAGASYVVTVSSRRYAFANGTQLISLDDNISGLDFTASQ